MRVWINALGAQGLTPHIESIATAQVERLGDEEDRLIRKHAKDGHRLLNSPYYHRNLADIIQPVTETIAPPSKSDSVLKCDAVSHKLYGPIATARAAGKMTAVQAGVRVLVRSPAVSAAHLWFATTSSRVCRRFGWLVVWGAYLWMIGLDRLAQDRLFPLLPLAEAAGFWHAYLGGPAQTLGWHLLIVFLMNGAIWYRPVAEAAGVPRAGESSDKGSRTPPQQHADLAAGAAAALDQAIREGRVPSPLVDDLLRGEQEPDKA
jgi:hypothetical protein